MDSQAAAAPKPTAAAAPKPAAERMELPQEPGEVAEPQDEAAQKAAPSTPACGKGQGKGAIYEAINRMTSFELQEDMYLECVCPGVWPHVMQIYLISSAMQEQLKEGETPEARDKRLARALYMRFSRSLKSSFNANSYSTGVYLQLM